MYRCKKFIGIGFIFSLFFIIVSNTLAIGVKPLVLSLDGKPGETLNFKITVRPEKVPVSLKLSVYKLVQKLNGSLDFQPVEPATFPPAGWVSMPSKVQVNPGKDMEINGKVKIPFDAIGSNFMLVMVEPEAEKNKVNGLETIVRYGVMMRVRAERPGIRVGAQVNGLDLVKGAKGNPVIQVQIKNTSPIDYSTSATVFIRDNQKKLMAKMELRPEYFWSKKTDLPIIYPFGELLYVGDVTEFLPPGQYELKLIFRYSSSGQIVNTKTIEIRDGDYVFPADKIKSLLISPQEINCEGRPGVVVSKALKFENKTDKPITITLEPNEIEESYSYSIFNNTSVGVMGENRFVLDPKQILMKIITIKFPKDALVQGNYGYINIRAFSSDEKPKLIEDSNIKLSATIIGEKKRTVKVLGLTGDRDDRNHLLSLAVENNGNIKIAPRAVVILKDKEERILASINLVCTKENTYVLPTKMIYLTGIVNINPGTYKAEVQVLEGETELGTSEQILQLK